MKKRIYSYTLIISLIASAVMALSTTAFAEDEWKATEGVMYHHHADGTIHVTSDQNPITCVKGGKITYTCTECAKTQESEFTYPKGHSWDAEYKCTVCGTVGIDISTATINFGTVDNPRESANAPSYEKTNAGIRPNTYVSFDGKTALNWSSDDTLKSDNTMRDVYVTWTNDKGIGKAYVNFTGRGNYYGEAKLEYNILPASVKVFKAQAGVNSVTLSWETAIGADYYRVYRAEPQAGGKVTRIKLGEVTGTSYKVTGLEPGTEYTFSVATSAKSTDGKGSTFNCSKWADVTVTTNYGMLSDVKTNVGENEIKMISKSGMNYIMLPGHADINDLKLSFVASGDIIGKEAQISGDLGSESLVLVDGENTVTLDLESIASMSDGIYNIKIATGDEELMELVVMQGTNVMSMFITSQDPDAKGREFVDASKSNKAKGSMNLINTDGKEVYNGALSEIKARGNSTFAHFPKKAYQIKLDKKTDLLNNGEKIKTWVLLANYGDATMMHDKFMKDLARQMDMHQTANLDWINLWYDGEYRGTYTVGEKNSVESTGVDITDMEELYEELNPEYGDIETTATGYNKYGQMYQYTVGLTDPEDITGGYLIELNHKQFDEINGFKTRQGVAFNLKSPEYLSENAVKYISEYYQEFEDAVYAVNDKGEYTGYNEQTGKYFYEYVDIDSLVKIFTIQEVGLNPDGFISSVFFNKDVDGIMYVGPLWDQDMTFGTGWTKYIDASIKDYHYLAKALINIPIFKARLANFFENEALPMLEEALSDGGTIDRHAEKLTPSANMNYALWQYIRVGNPSATGHLWKDADYDLVVEDMKTWLEKRLGYLKPRFLVETGHVHAYGEWMSDGDENHIKECLCGEKITEAHAFDEGVVTLEPTTEATGEKTYTCSVCGHKKIEVLDKLAPSYKLGDLDDDGTIDVRDVINLRRFIAGGYDVTVNENAVDINKDDSVDVRDVITLRRFIAGGYDIEL